MRPAVRHQHAAHPYRRLRHHAADLAAHRCSDEGWEIGLTWVFVQSFILMIGGFVTSCIRKITCALLCSAPRRRVDRVHRDAPGTGDVHDAGDRAPLIRRDPGELVRRPALSRKGHPAGLVAIGVGPTTSVLTADGAASLIGCLMSNPFINAVHIGHPGWTATGGRFGYSSGLGLMVAALPRFCWRS